MNMTEYEQEIRKRLTEDARCPLCAALQDREFDILAHLQYVVTLDPAIRHAVAAEGGFCDFHFRQFRKLANAQTNALLLITLVHEYCRRGSALPLRCRLCAELASYENNLLEEMARLLGDNSVRDLYEQSSGLCVSHMHSFGQRSQNPDIKSLVNNIQILQMQRDLPALTAMSERSFFETNQSQRSSIARVVEKLVGRKALGL
jgi:hypothetical protein